MAVPYFDLARAKQRVAQEVTARWQSVLDSGAFVLGPEVRAFEEAFTQWLGAAGCVGVANGTDALVVALRTLGAGPGDEVIVPAFTFFATAEAVSLVGATPVFADVDATTYNLEPPSVAAAVTSRTVGIIGVHLYGRPCDMTALGELRDRHNLWLIEDAAQAQGARWKDRAVGTWGTLAAWSFYPSKNLGCFGDGGAVTGPDAALLERVRRIANHGQEGRYHHLEIGVNSRLDSLQAAVLNCRLPLLDGDNEARRQAARSYRETLAGVGDLSFPKDAADATCVYHQMAVRTGRRDELIKFLAAREIGTSVHYPSPLHHQPAYSGTAAATASLPVAERAAEELLCLPMFPEITSDEVAEACEAIAAFYSA